MDKTALRSALLALEQHELQAAREAYDDYLASSKPDRTEADDIEDHSLNVEGAELAEGLEAPLLAAEEAMRRLQAIDFSPRSTIAPGAVFELGGQRFVVAVATRPFTVDGQSVMGISAESPLYGAVRDKASGETAEFRGKQVRIGSVG